MRSFVTEYLAALLEGHGVASVAHDDHLLVPGSAFVGDLCLFEDQGAAAGMMELRAWDADGTGVIDTWMAYGEDREAKIRDGVHAFVVGTVHVALAALWGVLESDQVDVETRSIGGQTWDGYLGGMVGRGDAPEVPPDLFERLMSAWFDRIAQADGRTTHTFRVFVASRGGNTTYEALFDGEPDEGLREALRCAGWAFPSDAYGSRRWFGIARRREGHAPAHTTTRMCGAQTGSNRNPS
jgi:hypothetical protein